MLKKNFSILFLMLLSLSGCSVDYSNQGDAKDIMQVSFPCASKLSAVYLAEVYGLPIDVSNYQLGGEDIGLVMSKLESEYSNSSIGTLARSACYLSEGQEDKGRYAFEVWLSEGGVPEDDAFLGVQDVLYLEALVYAELGLIDAAINSVGRALGFDAENSMLWSFAGALQISSGNSAKALLKYSKALETTYGCSNVCPKNVECYCPESEEAYLGRFVASTHVHEREVFCPELQDAIKHVSASTILMKMYKRECL